MKIDFKNFCLEDLEKYIKEKEVDIFIKWDIRLNSREKITISDYMFVTISKGCENIYVDFPAWKKDDSDAEQYEIGLWTKEFHEELKEIINEITKQA